MLVGYAIGYGFIALVVALLAALAGAAAGLFAGLISMIVWAFPLSALVGEEAAPYWGFGSFAVLGAMTALAMAVGAGLSWIEEQERL